MDARSVIAVARLEVLSLARATAIPILVVLVIATVALVLQAPDFAAGADGFPFVSRGVEALLVLLALLVPIAASGDREPTAVGLVTDSLRTVIAWWLGLLSYLMVIAISGLGLLYTLDRISVPHAAAAGIRLLLVAGPVAALAPAVRLVAGPGARGTFAWMCVLAGSIGIFGIGLPIPIDRLLSAPNGLAGVAPLAASGLSTAAALVMSTAALERRCNGE